MGLFSIIGLIIASRVFLGPVSGWSFDIRPWLIASTSCGQPPSIDRFDIVVASEKDDDGKTKDIVKRVIGLPGDTIQYDNDTLYINGKNRALYLKDYISFQKINCNQPTLEKGLKKTRILRQLANTAQALQ